MTKSCAWDDLIGQTKAVSYLRSAIDTQTVGHAYLFVGPAGAGKKTAAKAFACAMLCEDGGCGACPVCYRIKRGLHPDVQVFEPEGASSYLLREQIRPLINGVHMRPVEAMRKVYIVGQADLMRDDSANAFLKTLEEPPADVVIIMLAPTLDSVLPTIASRCLVVRFARIPASAAIDLLRSRTAASRIEAQAGLAATGGVLTRAVEFLESSSRRAARERMLGILKDLTVLDEFDVLASARELLTLVKAPLEELKEQHAQELLSRQEFMGKAPNKSVEDRQKRELTAREREGVAEILNVTESWLRDCLVMSQGLGDMVVNGDAADAMEEVAAIMTPGAATRALDAVNETRRRISYNVSPQLAIEAMLFDIREVLLCPR
ncbi:MAG: DNA polymerase III subunit delta' C-terminal domain-containing protein [Actinomycetota bacterium]|nr:DNA polymerase III subunit delta' C-terminal domain-containing protein [Actinomycetota bacterium]